MRTEGQLSSEEALEKAWLEAAAAESECEDRDARRWQSSPTRGADTVDEENSTQSTIEDYIQVYVRMQDGRLLLVTEVGAQDLVFLTPHAQGDQA